MKRIYISAAVAAVAVSVSAGSVMAADSSIAVTIGNEDVTYSYTASDEVFADSIKNLFSELEDSAADETAESEMLIESSAVNNENIAVGLRLSIDEADADSEYSVLDYYTFRITDSNGDVIYDSADEEPAEENATEKDIPLGVFNTDFTRDSKKYTIELGVNEDVAASVSEKDVRDMDIMVTAVKYEAAAAETPVPSANATLAPKFELAPSEATDAPAAAEEATAAPTETAAPTATPAATESAEVKERKIICGEDIEPGRYTITGNANVRITTADGEMISETTVTDGTHDVKGVDQFITSIEKGDIITITPISDDIKAAVNFERTNSGSSSETKSTTAASKATSAPGRNSASRATAAPSSSKTNPKTGDAGLTSAVMGSVMGISAAAAGSLEIIKRRKKDDK